MAATGLLVRAMDQEPRSAAQTDPSMGWAGLIKGGLEVVSCPGDHLGVISKQHVGIAAAAVDEYLAALDPRPPARRLPLSSGPRGR